MKKASNYIVLIISLIFMLSFKLVPCIIGIIGASCSLIAIFKDKDTDKDDESVDPDDIDL